MSTATVTTRPAKVYIGFANGLEEAPAHRPGVTLMTYLKDLGADVKDSQTAVVGGKTVDLDTVLEPEAAATLAPKPANG